MSEQVGPDYCPFCASEAEPRRTDPGALPLFTFGLAPAELPYRAYRCLTCGREWKVEGAQQRLDLSA